MLRSRRFFLASLASAALLVAASPAAYAGAGEGKLRANLVGTSAAPGATGRADFRPPRTEKEKGKTKTKPAELKVEVQKLRLAAGTKLDVILVPQQGPPVKVGTLTINKGGAGKFEATTQAAVAKDDVIRVVTQGATQTILLTGTFKPHV